MGLLCVHTLEQRALENHGLFLHDLATHWLFYRARLSRDTEINNLLWEDWPEDILRKPDFHYIDPQRTLILGLIVSCAPLEDNSPRNTPLDSLSTSEVVPSINTSRPVLSFQLDITSEIHIPQVVTQTTLSTLIRHSETVSLGLSSSPSLSNFLSVCSRVFQPYLRSFAEDNHEFQPKIDPILEHRSPSPIKTNSRPPGAPNQNKVQGQN